MRTRILFVLTMTAFSLALVIGASVTRADARAVQVEQPQAEMVKRNPVLYVEHVQRRWFYAELADGSAWMVTRCRVEDSENCWWDARKRGVGGGRSFLDLRGHQHFAVRGTVIG